MGLVVGLVPRTGSVGVGRLRPFSSISWGAFLGLQLQGVVFDVDGEAGSGVFLVR